MSMLPTNYEISCEDGLKLGLDNLLNPNINVKYIDWKSNGIPSNIISNTEDCTKIVSYTDKKNKNGCSNLNMTPEKKLEIKNKIKKYLYYVTILIFFLLFIFYLIKTKRIKNIIELIRPTKSKYNPKF